MRNLPKLLMNKMRIPYLIARFLTGALFVFSGIVKLNDPSGFGIKLNEYFDVFAQDFAETQDSMRLLVYCKGQKLIDQKTTLYSFDTEKSMLLEAQGVVEDVEEGGPAKKQINVRCSWGGSSVAEAVFDVNDSTVNSVINFEYIAAPPHNMPSVSHIGKLKNGGVLRFDMSNPERAVSSEIGYKVSGLTKPNGKLFDFFKWLKEYSLYLSVFFCALEVLLGLAMLIGWNIRLTVAITAGLIIFFTFLTGYSAYFNKVTDCGCFGDFLKLKPWHSFYKDLVLLGLVSIMILGIKQNTPWFSKPFGHKLMLVLTMLTISFGIYCYKYLPIWDFLPYKVGNDIKQVMTDVPSGMRATDSIEISWVLYKPNSKGGIDSIQCATSEFSKNMEAGYQYDDQKSQRRRMVIEGYKSPIHDFAINDDATGIDMKDTFLNASGFQLAFVMPYLEQGDVSQLDELKEVLNWSKSNGVRVYGLTSASAGPSADFIKRYKLDIKFYSADQKMLLTMARYNPTLFMLKGAKILEKWSGADLPTPKKLDTLRRKEMGEKFGLAKVFSRKQSK